MQKEYVEEVDHTSSWTYFKFYTWSHCINIKAFIETNWASGEERTLHPGAPFTNMV